MQTICKDGHNRTVQTITISCNHRDNFEVILRSHDHGIVELDFINFFFSGSGFCHILGLLYKSLLLLFECFIAYMGFYNPFITFRIGLDFETKKFRISALDIYNPRFLRGYFQLQPFLQPLRYCNHCFFCIGFCTAEDPKIICITNDSHFF